MAECQSIWGTFRSKLEDLFVTGYKLPEVLHVTAIENIEGELETWKGKLAQNDKADKAFNETIVHKTGKSENTSSLRYGEESQNDKEVANGSDTPEVDTVGSEDYVIIETGVPDDEESDGNAPAVDSPVTVETRPKKGRPTRRNSKTAKTTPVKPVRASRRKSAQVSPKTSPDPPVENAAQQVKSEPNDDDQQTINEANEDLLNSTMPKTCPLCLKVYSSRSGYAYHMKKHKEGEFRCDLCRFVGATNQHLTSHISKAHTEDGGYAEFTLKKAKIKEEKLFCYECGKKFKSDRNLRAHMSFHQTGSLKCPECPKEFLSKVGYDNHIRLHTGEDLHRCRLCTYVVGSPSMLATHMRRVHERVEKYLCDVCGKGFVTTFRMKRHKEVTHMKDELKDRYHCPHCDHKTHCEAGLKAHIKNLHTDTPGFMCNICGITLKYKHSLIDHQRRHSSKKNYQCSECPFRGICAKDVKNHIRRKHQEANEKCETCGKCFKQKGHLRRHRVIHTGEKKFACRLCSYCCNVKGNLRKHMLQVHKTNERQRPIIEKIDNEVEEVPVQDPEEHAIATVAIAAVEGYDSSEQAQVEYYNLGQQHNVQTVIMEDNLIANFDQVGHQVEVSMEEHRGLPPIITALLHNNPSNISS